jgi:hypothetical protein
MPIKKIITYVFFVLLLPYTCLGQTNMDSNAYHYVANGIDAAIFPASRYPLIGKMGKGFTPTLAEVDSAEVILKRALKDLGTRSPGPLVNYDLTKYRRQYWGYIDPATGHKILYINIFWKIFQYSNDWLKEDIEISEGGGYYCNVKFDLTTLKLYDYKVNGTE